MAGRRPHLVATVCALAATIAALAFVVVEARAYHLDVPFWDEWLLLPLLKLDAAGQLTWTHLLAPHNEHRPLVSRLILIALARATHWNLWYECVLVIATGVIAVAPFWILLRPAHEPRPLLRAILLTVAGVTFLSMNQWENWLWGWQLKVLLTTAGATWGALALTVRTPWLACVGASLGGIVATLSFGNGFLVWPAMLPVAWWSFRRHPVVLGAWLAVATAVTYLFFTGLGQPLEVNRALGSATPWRVFTSAARIMGGAVTPEALAPWSITAGLVGLGLAAAVIALVVRERHDDRVTRVVMPLLLFGVATAVLIATGRRFGRDEAIPARYLAFVDLSWIAMAIVAVRRLPRLVPVALLLPALAVATGWQARHAYVERHESLLKWRASLYAPIDNPLVDRFFWAPGFVGPWLHDLRAMRLSLYDCETQLSVADWEAAAALIAEHGRPDDIVVTSSDWGAECLRGRLAARRSKVAVASAHETSVGVRELMAGRTSAFLVSGGDVASADARRVVEGSGYPAYRSPVGSMRLFYAPGRIEFVRDRLAPDEVAADLATFAALGDLALAPDERFLLKGWLRRERTPPPGHRVLVTRTGAVYVPVVRDAPVAVELALAAIARQASPSIAVVVNGARAAAVTIDAGAPAIRIPLSGAAWRYGSNIVEIEIGQPTDDLSALPDDAPVAVFARLAFLQPASQR